jgi:pimeloyl-ACP methyl ester carboxylesterase
MLSSRAQWLPNLAALAQVCRPVTLELWGHGRSPAPADPAAYHPDAYVAAFERLREAVGAERWFVCGQSFGAALTLRYGLAHPERVIAQVFTNSASALADADTVKTYRETAKQRGEAVRRDGLAGLESIRVHPKHARRLPAEVQEALVADARLARPEAFALTFAYTSPHLSNYAAIGANQVPTLYVHGGRERRLAHMREVVPAVVPHVEMMVAEDAGHAVNIEAADAFNQAVIDFLRRHAAAAA